MAKYSNSDNHFKQYKVQLIGPKRSIVVQSFLDTGAASSVISSSLLTRLGIDKNINVCHQEKVMTANGSKIVSYIKVKVVAESRRLTIMPAISDDMPLPLMLGLDFLKKTDYIPLFIQKFSMLYGFIRKNKKGCVLIIGNDSTKEGIGKLHIIQEELKKYNYEGILLKDYSDIAEQTVEEKMNLFGTISKFIICEDSCPSGHIDELNICARNRFVTVIMQEKGKYSTWLQECYPIDFNFIKKIQYGSKAFKKYVGMAVKIAETTVLKRKKMLNDLYIYRKKNNLY